MTRPFMSMTEKRRFEQGQNKTKALREKVDLADEIRDEFDCNPNITVAQLASRFGMTVNEIKKILLEE